VRAFRQALKDTGYVEGENAAIVYRWAEGRYDRLPELAAGLVRRQVAMIAASDSGSANAAKAATTTIPIVFGVSEDPVHRPAPQRNRSSMLRSAHPPGGDPLDFRPGHIRFKNLARFTTTRNSAWRSFVLR